MSNNDTHQVTRSDCTPWRDEDTLRHFYHGKRYSLLETANAVGCTEGTVSQWCDRLNIETRDAQEARDTGTPEDLKDGSRMRELYLTLELTCAEIADEYDVTSTTVSRWLRRHDIPTRPAHGLGCGYVSHECENCGKTFSVKPARKGAKYCSRDCYYAALDMPTGSDHWSYNSTTLVCENCGGDFTVQSSTSEERQYCSRSCFADGHDFPSGEEHPAWNENRRYMQNGELWERTRRQCRERDGYRCRICNDPEPEDRQHDVHHLIPVRYFEDSADAHWPGNVVTLCRSCHMQWENRTPFLPCVVPA